LPHTVFPLPAPQLPLVVTDPADAVELAEVEVDDNDKDEDEEDPVQGPF